MALTDEERKDLLSNPVADVVAMLDDLGPDDVLALQALEREGKNRKGLIDAIESYIEAQQGDTPDASVSEEGQSADPAEGAGETEAGTQDAEPAPADAKAERGERPAYMKADYSGPLTIDQAEWRNNNLRQK